MPAIGVSQALPTLPRDREIPESVKGAVSLWR